MRRRRVVMSRIIPLKKADRSFDLEFWHRIGVEGRLKAAWDMVLDLPRWNPAYAVEQRLRRSVGSLKRR